MRTVTERLEALGVSLPPAPPPVAAYVPAVAVGDLIFVSGQLPLRAGVLTAAGPVPSAVSVEEAQAAARQAVLNALAVVSDALEGDLGRVRRVVRLGVFVASEPGFAGQPRSPTGRASFWWRSSERPAATPGPPSGRWPCPWGPRWRWRWWWK